MLLITPALFPAKTCQGICCVYFKIRARWVTTNRLITNGENVNDVYLAEKNSLCISQGLACSSPPLLSLHLAVSPADFVPLWRWRSLHLFFFFLFTQQHEWHSDDKGRGMIYFLCFCSLIHSNLVDSASLAMHCGSQHSNFVPTSPSLIFMLSL